MAGRAIWKGHIRFSDVDVPVKLHTAVHQDRIQFHLLHKRDRVRLHQQMICAYENVPVPAEEQTRGYEVEDRKYILVDPEELEQTGPLFQRAAKVQAAQRGLVNPAQSTNPAAGGTCGPSYLRSRVRNHASLPAPARDRQQSVTE